MWCVGLAVGADTAQEDSQLELCNENRSDTILWELSQTLDLKTQFL